MIVDEEIENRAEMPRKHSGLGIAAFCIALVQGALTAVAVVLSGVYTNLGGQEEYPVAFMLIGFGIIGGILFHLVGVGLGIAGLCQKGRKKTFSILGLVLNLLPMVMVCSLMIIGLAVMQ